MTQPTPQETLSFQGLGIGENFLKVLTYHKFLHPTPIQHQSIPPGIEGKDLIGIAQTGTGKTLAFGIPMIQRIAQNKGQGLIVVPTRELAIQVDETLRKIGTPLGLKTAVIIGGEFIGRQKNALQRRPHIIIATPGRLNDHLQQRNFHLRDIKVFVLDEADRMFDMGFAPQIQKIFQLLPKERQTLLFSATMPAQIRKIAETHMSLPLQIEVAPAGTSGQNIEQEIFFVRKEDKIRLLEKILAEFQETVLIFSRTKYGAKKISEQIANFGHKAEEIHSNKSLSQRIRALEGFKSGKFRILVATDIAARGIDVKNIGLVINYDLPDNSEDYVHRIGRTGRAGKTGKAISFATPDQKNDIRNIERLIRKSLRISQVPHDLPERKFQAPPTQTPTQPNPFQKRNPFPRNSRPQRQKNFSRKRSW